MAAMSSLGEELKLRDYLRIVGRWKHIVAAVAVVFIAGAALLTVAAKPVYRASSQVLLRAQAADPLQDATTNQSAPRNLNNEVRQIESAAARDAVGKVYTGPLDPAAVHASIASSDADVIEFTASGADAQDVADLVNTYVKTYIDFRRQQDVSDVLAAGTTIRAKTDEVRKSIDTLMAPLHALDAQIATATGDRVLALRDQRQQVATDIQAQLTSLQSQLSYYQEQLDRLELSATVRQTGALQLLRAADAPSSPVSPKPIRNMALGIGLGLLFGVGAAFVRNQFDDTIRSRESLEHQSEAPTIGAIPRWTHRKRSSRGELVVVGAPRSPAAEAFRTLRTSIRFLGVEPAARVIQVSSPTLGDGKTIVAANLAATFAQAGERVAIVGCDLRRPRLDALLRVPSGPGLTDVLLGDARLDDAIWSDPDVARLSVVRTGTLPPDPAELLGSSAAATAIAELLTMFDRVILDCSPVLPVTDALVLAPAAEATLLVVADGRTTRGDVAAAVRLLRQVDAPLVGCVLNFAATEHHGQAYREHPLPAVAHAAVGPAGPAHRPHHEELDGSAGSPAAEEPAQGGEAAIGPSVDDAADEAADDLRDKVGAKARVRGGLFAR